MGAPAPAMESGVCRGCGTPKLLRSDGKVRDHLPPLDQRRAGDATPCPGGGLPAEGETARPAVTPTVVKIPAKKLTNRGECRICGRNCALTVEGRVRAHVDGSRFPCDGAGKMPRRAAS